MKNLLTSLLLLIIVFPAFAQNTMTPELLWELGRVSAIGLTQDGNSVVYRVTHYDIDKNNSRSQTFSIPLQGGNPQEIENADELVSNHRLSPNGQYLLSVEEVKVHKVYGKDFYPALDKSEVMIYDELNYRHWDEWEDGAYNHLFLHPVTNGEAGEGKDIMEGEPHDCPQKPFGGDEDFVWSPDSKQVLYVTKKKYGKAYAISTNTDIYAYDLESGTTTNLTEGRLGYDTQPAFSATGTLAWLSMNREGYESDKNDLIVRHNNVDINLTQRWDGTVNGFEWAEDGRNLFFTAPVDGTVQLFTVDDPGITRKLPVVRQITEGMFDITGIVGQKGNTLIVTRTDMNHAAELYTVDITNGQMQQLTHVNDAIYNRIGLSKIEKRMVTTTDGEEMLVWVIYPPNFDPTQKYPTLLYCQGGPQGALSQFYSFRWNFQLMAGQGYIVVAPNRRGMPGHGVSWNEEISKDWGGQAMQDYLSAIDEVAQESFVDNDRLGCVGASFGGYSAFYLSGIHDNRFKTFIAHDGVFNLKSMYGTTEELWFVNWDIGGAYWEEDNAAAMKSYTQYDPSNFVDKWDTPILIIQGGKDYRVPIGQSLEAFQAAQLRGIKSRLLYFPNENHWVLSPQNALVWQREFYKWLEETL